MQYCLSLLPACLLAFSMIGCASSSTSPAANARIDESIPENAVEIRLYSDQEPDRYYMTIREELRYHGYTIEETNPNRRTLATGYKNVGSGVSLAIQATIQEDLNVMSTVAVLYGWSSRAGLRSPNPAAFEPGNVDDQLAFNAMVNVAKQLTHQNLEYRMK